MSDNIGIDFRGSAPFVTDPANCTYCLGEVYPITRGGYTFAFDAVPSAEDLSAAVDARLSGDCFRSHVAGPGQVVFKLDLTSSGSKVIRLALGGVGITNFPNVEVRDGVGGTVLFTVSDVAGCSAGQFYDATGVIRTDAADWVTNNASQTVTLTGTQLVVNLMYLSPLGGGRNAISHLSVVDAGGAPTSYRRSGC